MPFRESTLPWMRQGTSLSSRIPQSPKGYSPYLFAPRNETFGAKGEHDRQTTYWAYGSSTREGNVQRGMAGDTKSLWNSRNGTTQSMSGLTFVAPVSAFSSSPPPQGALTSSVDYITPQAHGTLISSIASIKPLTQGAPSSSGASIIPQEQDAVSSSVTSVTPLAQRPFVSIFAASYDTDPARSTNRLGATSSIDGLKRPLTRTRWLSFAPPPRMQYYPRHTSLLPGGNPLPFSSRIPSRRSSSALPQ
eukprot:GEMP01049695.1.p1 GENE.GEMP01049695.1~~GEMP01049695.1.p1  ORF type:complete len:248 (+),score=50.73 GEMP01049695.1:481-1224(+)